MDIELRCNRLTCRGALTDKAVVTTCSHIFCVTCAHELFNASRLCPACETSLTEPDDVVVCSLHPTNDYKTSVLSGLSPSTILEICSRAISFWQYQMHQESTFQQAVVRNVNDKNAQLQRQLENVIREANSEIELLVNKRNELERDLELERKKVRELQDSNREQNKEYQKLKAHYDKMKKKMLLGGPQPNDTTIPTTSQGSGLIQERALQQRAHLHANGTNLDIPGSGVQRTPLVTSNNGGLGFSVQESQRRSAFNRQLFGFNNNHGGDRSAGLSERSNSVNEVENFLLSGPQPRASNSSRNLASNWSFGGQGQQQNQRGTAGISASATKRGFRPAIGR